MTATLWLQAFLLALILVVVVLGSGLVVLKVLDAVDCSLDDRMLNGMGMDAALYRAIEHHAMDAAWQDLARQAQQDTHSPHPAGSMHAEIWLSIYTNAKAKYDAAGR